jgi:hypothetical protein
MSIDSRNGVETRPTRNISAISVPRPGPSSTRWAWRGEPAARQASVIQSPINSPNI